MRILLSSLTALVLFWSFPMLSQAQKGEPDVAMLVQGNNDFGLSLYQQVAAKEGNLFFSPYSISDALAMTYAGARGHTAEEMKTTLRFNLAADRLPPAFGKLIAQLDGDGKKRPFQLTVANRLWGQKDYGFLPEFTKIGTDFYHAGLEEVDFANSAEAARKRINVWVEKETKDKIKDLIPPGALDARTRLVLTNAIYFKAPWMTPFNVKATKSEPFHLANGKTIDAPMMHASHEDLLFASHESFAMVQLPYDGYGQSMIVLLPKKKDGLGELEKQLSAEALSKWMKKLSPHTVDVKLPKFKVTAEITLNNILQQMGMKDAFGGKADFSGMTTREKLYISAVIHKAFVDVNEAGTEAAAATAVVMRALAARQPAPPATFHADHPFVFLIRDNASGSILFAGRLANPGK